MKKIILLPFFICFFIACDSKKQGIYDHQKMINKQLTGLADSLEHVSDSESYNRIKGEINVLHLRFDSLNHEAEKLEKK